jgi:hypothetical protein
VITVIYASVKENRIFLMFFFSVNKEWRQSKWRFRVVCD